MRRRIAAVIVLLIAAMVVFISQSYFTPSETYVSPTGYAGGEDPGVVNITARIVKDTTGPKVNLSLSEEEFPFELKGYVCDPKLPDGTPGVGMLFGWIPKIWVDGEPVDQTDIITVGDEFTVKDFWDYLDDDLPDKTQWDIDIELVDALGNKETVEVVISAGGESSSATYYGSGGTWAKTVTLPRWYYINRAKIGIRFWLCEPDEFGNPWGGCEIPEGGDDAEFKAYRAAPTYTEFHSSSGYCCCGGLDCTSCSRNENWHSDTITLTGIAQRFKALANPSVCGYPWERHDGLRGFRVKVYFYWYKIDYVPPDYDKGCASDYLDLCHANEDGVCEGYDKALCNDTAGATHCEGNDLSHILTEGFELDQVEGCTGYCSCYDTTNCAENGQLCDPSTGQCADGCNATCFDDGYPGGLCGDQADFPMCDPSNSSQRFVFGDEITTFDCDLSEQDCVCYNEEACVDGLCVDGECVDCGVEGESCDADDDCCSGFKCEGNVCEMCFFGMECAVGGPSSPDCCPDYSYCCLEGVVNGCVASVDDCNPPA